MSNLVWEISHMVAIVKADRSRLSIRGIVDGASYRVQTTPTGWIVEPVVRAAELREWDGPQKDLTEHLDSLAESGLVIERTMDKEAPPCRF